MRYVLYFQDRGSEDEGEQAQADAGNDGIKSQEAAMKAVDQKEQKGDSSIIPLLQLVQQLLRYVQYTKTTSTENLNAHPVYCAGVFFGQKFFAAFSFIKMCLILTHLSMFIYASPL